MKVNIRKLFQKKPPQLQSTDVAMTSEKKDEEPHLKIAVQPEVAEKLNRFLKEKGLPERWALPLLVEYGLSDESEEELEKLRLEMQSKMRYLWGKYAIIKFKAYGLSMDNTRITMKLNMLLSENQLLKKRLKDEGFQSLVPNDEWDNWDNTVTAKYYDRYLFINRS